MKKAKEKCLRALFLIYIIVLFRITVFRSSFNLINLMQGTINLSLFQDYLPLIRQGRWFQFLYLFVGNIIWFVPFGSLIMALGKAKQIRNAVLCGLGLSLAIEVMQYILGTGVSELDDLVLNTLGAWIGAVGYHYIIRLEERL